MNARRLVTSLLALVMLFSLAACQSTPSNDNNSAAPEGNSASIPNNGGGAEDSAPVYGGDMTIYWKEINNYYDPAMLTGYGYSSFWLEGLWTIDLASGHTYDGTYLTYDMLTGQIADSYVWDESSGTLTVTIRDDIYFQDKEPVNGRQLTAADVKYSYDRVLGTDPSVSVVETENDWRADFYMIDAISTQGNNVVIFQFGESYHTEIALNDFMITALNITSHEWDECAQTWDCAYGTGPFILTGTEAGSTLYFSKNPNYYDCDERYPQNKLPYLDSVTLVTLQDSTTAMTQFISGDIEMLVSTVGVLSTSEEKVLSSSLNPNEYLTYSFGNANPRGLTVRSDTAPFDDIRVRTALQMSIDVESIFHNYYGYDYDCVIPSMWSSMLSDYIWEQPADVAAEYTYNVEKAKELLAEAGYPDGFSFEIVVCPIITDVDLFVLIKDYFAAVGVTMEITTVSDIPEMLGVSLSKTDERGTPDSFGGFNGITAVQMNLVSGGASYAIRAYDDEFEAAVDDFISATTLEARNAAAVTMDKLYITNHWILCLGGYSPLNGYVRSTVRGYMGTQLYGQNWGGTVLSHVWKSEA